MEYKDLYPITLLLVLVGMIVGVGVLTLDKTMVYGSDVGNFNESLAVTNATGTAFIKNYVKTVTFVGNASNDCTNSSTFSTFKEETVHITVTDSTDCIDDTCCGTLAGTWDIEGTFYDVTGASGTAFGNARTAVGEIAENWMSLIVTIIVLAIILTLVIRSFGKTR